MNHYQAIGKGQYIDNHSKVTVIEFDAENDRAAYNYIVNHCDCSLIWDYKQVELEA